MGEKHLTAVNGMKTKWESDPNKSKREKIFFVCFIL